MKKIFVRRDESIAELLEKIISSEENDVVLVIPKASGVGDAVSNFDLIKRESEAAGKKIFVESVDEKILALAKSLRIEALHPLFEGARRSVLSDIVPTSAGGSELPSEKQAGKRITRQKRGGSPRGEEKREEPKVPLVHVSKKEARHQEFQEQEAIEKQREEQDVPLAVSKAGRRKFLFVAIFLGCAFLVAVAVWLVNTLFGTANITIHFKKTPWAYEHAFLADTSVSRVDKNAYVLPGQLFTSEKNNFFQFPASGVKNVSEKATGVIRINNAYSSASQLLVATTRFETPDGKIFRLSKQTLVPGAKIQDGKIIPSSIDAAIIADAPGAAYNLGPIQRLTIPGFKGSPKYNSFYGEIVQPTKGGLVGQKKVPTASDIKSAKDKTTDTFKTVLESNLIAGYPQDFTHFDSAREFKITKLIVNENTDDKGNFSVFGEAKISTIGFRESDMRELLNSIAIAGDSTLTLKDLGVDYQGIKANIAAGKLSFSVAASGTVTTGFSKDDFRAKLVGRTVDEVRFSISQLPGLSDAKISVWPLWLRHVPSDINRIKILSDY